MAGMKPEPVFDDAIDAKARREREQEARREAARLRFRSLFPELVPWLDTAKELFGDGVEVIYAITDDGGYVGKLPDEVREEHERNVGPLRKLRLYDADNQDIGGPPARKD